MIWIIKRHRGNAKARCIFFERNKWKNPFFGRILPGHFWVCWAKAGWGFLRNNITFKAPSLEMIIVNYRVLIICLVLYFFLFKTTYFTLFFIIKCLSLFFRWLASLRYICLSFSSYKRVLRSLLRRNIAHAAFNCFLFDRCFLFMKLLKINCWELE